VKKYLPNITVIALLAAAVLVLACSGRVRLVDELGVVSALPERVGTRTAHEWRYCQNDQCLAAFRLTELGDPDTCPKCAAALAAVSLGEERFLPAGTEISRRSYVAPDGEEFMVSIVFSSYERRSIHKPQVCLVGQGNSIVDERIVRVPLSHGEPLDIMLLDVRRPSISPGAPDAASFSYAYWFTSGVRRTPRHVVRLFWIAWDSVFHNTRRRWAYISVAASRKDDGNTHVARLSSFIAELYPLIHDPVHRESP
jgi:hypothetical protein